VSLHSALIKQFRCPQGFLGILAGRVMATRQSNLQRNLWTVDLLDLQPDDRVLELGPGPGVTLSVILDKLPNGFVVGVDHSATMLRQCEKKNRRDLDAGRLKLLEGNFTELPELPGVFDKILAVNSLQFDAMNPEALKQVVRYLTDDGTLAITFQPRGQDASNEKAREFGEKLAAFLTQAGLARTRLEILPMQPVSAVCVLAQRA